MLQLVLTRTGEAGAGELAPSLVRESCESLSARFEVVRRRAADSVCCRAGGDAAEKLQFVQFETKDISLFIIE